MVLYLQEKILAARILMQEFKVNDSVVPAVSGLRLKSGENNIKS